MELIRWEPFNGLSALHGRINELFDHGFVPTWAHLNGTNGTWLPPVDILESKDAYLIRAELPGMKKEDFKLELHDGTLTLSGERKYEKPADGVEYQRSERFSGRFSRSFALTETVNQEGISATYRDGILEVHVPKADAAKPRQITIN